MGILDSRQYQRRCLRDIVNPINVEKMNRNFIKHRVRCNVIFDPRRDTAAKRLAQMDRRKTNGSFFKIPAASGEGYISDTVQREERHADKLAFIVQMLSFDPRRP